MSVNWLCHVNIVLHINLRSVAPHPQTYGPAPQLAEGQHNASIMFLKTSFTTLIVGVFVVYVLHTCWVMYGIVYTKPCDSLKSDNCITPFLAGKPKLQVSDVTGWSQWLMGFRFQLVFCSAVSPRSLVWEEVGMNSHILNNNLHKYKWQCKNIRDISHCVY